MFRSREVRRHAHRWFEPLLVCIIAVAILSYFWSHQRVVRTSSVLSGDRQVRLLALGDSGTGSKQQTRVASAMGVESLRERHPLDAVLLLGDNFYSDLTGTQDPKWQSLFESMYSLSSLDAPFYALLGNHEYGHDLVSIELDYAIQKPRSRWKMPARWYRLQIPDQAPLVTILMLDSNIDSLSHDAWLEQMQWFTAELAKPRSTPWLVVAAHHPLHSSGEHGGDPRLVAAWAALMQAAKVDFYVSGHDHHLEHFQENGTAIDFLISGGGGARSRAVSSIAGSTFAQRANGFIAFRFGKRTADVTIVDDSGEVLHSFSRSSID